jgi:hypothetical protein
MTRLAKEERKMARERENESPTKKMQIQNDYIEYPSRLSSANWTIQMSVQPYKNFNVKLFFV